MTFHGYPTKILQNQYYTLEYMCEAGPRIVRFSLNGWGGNLLAEEPDAGWQTPYGPYSLYGGHRLWYAPEREYLTGFPDNQGLQVEELANSVILKQGVETATGLQRSLRVDLEPFSHQVVLTHSLTNQSTEEMEIAPWAITMLPPGGVMILPQSDSPQNGSSLLPNRNLVLWPYARWDDKRLTIEEDHLLVTVKRTGKKLKFGYENSLGWAAYWHEDTLFCKRFEVQSGFAYPDRGCNLEVFLNDQYCELESLGPLRRIKPGQCLQHRETWLAYPVGKMPKRDQDAWMVASNICGLITADRIN